MPNNKYRKNNIIRKKHLETIMVIISSVKKQQMRNLVSEKYDTKNSFPTKYSWITKGRRVTLSLEKAGKHPLDQEITVTITRQRTNHTAPPAGWNESIFLLWYSCRRCILNLTMTTIEKPQFKNILQNAVFQSVSSENQRKTKELFQIETY